ncbi:hypothetical protein QFC21_000236 [Naganishia friedmannii]|uniref:Uncharacterized protein n=1 Tax=Naganishia friedmannii TaxID=89922 RepID=A0ACC2WCQ8_9TREE|nr:hypothetical protein QFC21_000236 [Naganishia friedmannii]
MFRRPRRKPTCSKAAGRVEDTHSQGMFSILGLFNPVNCPDEACTRSPCLFSHDIRQRPAPVPPKQEPLATHRTTNPESRQIQSRLHNDITSSNGNGVSSRPAGPPQPPRERPPTSVGVSLTPDVPPMSVAAMDMARGLTAQSSRVSSNASAGGGGYSRGPISQHTNTLASGLLKRPNKISKPASSSSASSNFPTSSRNSPNPPTLRAVSKLSKQPILDRQRSYPDLAAATATRQEQDTAEATNKNSYTQAIHSVLIELRQRPIPVSPDSPYVGTIKESREKVRLEEERKDSEVTVERVRGYVIPLAQLPTWGFMTAVPEEAGDTEPDAVGEEKTCDRCHEKFTVSSATDYSAFQKQAGRGECVYHWGKQNPARQQGARVWLWTCCGEGRDSEGCVDGLHVFRDGYEFGHVPQEGEVPEAVLLHRRKAFKSTQEVIRELGERQEKKRKAKEVYDIAALDCEMISTTAGLVLGRISVIDAHGRPILDRCVKPSATILDLNTRFSGLTEQDMANAKQDLETTRSELCGLIDENTIIIGHGLDNDLKTLRLVHTRIIDTAVMFPHGKGPPYRRALRDVLSEKIGTFIQNNLLEEGHDSTADARAALDLVRWRVKADVSAGLLV